VTDRDIPSKEQLCACCGMSCTPREYHPYAACLMFQQCHNSTTVRANLHAVLAHGREAVGETRAVDPELQRLGLPQSWNEACAYALKVVPEGLTDDSEAGLYMTVRNAYISGVQRDDWGVTKPLELRASLKTGSAHIEKQDPLV